MACPPEIRQKAREIASQNHFIILKRPPGVKGEVSHSQQTALPAQRNRRGGCKLQRIVPLPRCQLPATPENRSQMPILCPRLNGEQDFPKTERRGSRTPGPAAPSADYMVSKLSGGLSSPPPQRPFYRWYITLPSTMVRATVTLRSSSLGRARRFWFSSTRSASIPGWREPFSPSSKVM